MASSEFSLPFPTELQTLITTEKEAIKEPEPTGEPEPDPNMSIHSVYMSEGGLSSTVRLVTKRPSSPDYAYKDKSALFPGSPSPVQQRDENIRPSNSPSAHTSCDVSPSNNPPPYSTLPGAFPAPSIQSPCHPESPSPKIGGDSAALMTEFTFRAPMPRVSIDGAKKASLRADILGEMNRRMLDNAPSTGVPPDLFSEASKKRARESEQSPKGYSRFAVAHERELNK